MSNHATHSSENPSTTDPFTSLTQQDHKHHTHGPPTCHLSHLPYRYTRIGRLGAATCRRSIRQRTIQQNGVCSIYIRNRDQALVQPIVATIAQDAVDVVGAIILVTTTLDRFVAPALYGPRLVLVRRRVVVPPRRAIGVHVYRVVPESRPERKRTDPEKDRIDAARRTRAGAIGNRAAAAVKSASAVGRWRTGAGRCAASCGGCRGACAAWRGSA